MVYVVKYEGENPKIKVQISENSYILKPKYHNTVVNEQPKRLILPVGTVVGKCPKCGQPLIIKKGKFGKFVSCHGFQINGCKNTYSLEHFKVFDKKLLNKLNVYDALKHDQFHKIMAILGDKEYMDELPKDLQDELWSYNNVASGFGDEYYCRIKVTL